MQILLLVPLPHHQVTQKLINKSGLTCRLTWMTDNITVNEHFKSSIIVMSSMSHEAVGQVEM